MKVKHNLGLGLATLLSIVTVLMNMDLETLVLLTVAVMMIPCIIFSLWSLTFALICQLFLLGVKLGFLLTTSYSVIMVILRFAKWKPAAGTALGIDTSSAKGVGVKCTPMDVILTVLFQTGVTVPSGMWNGLMDNFVKNSGGGDGVGRLSKITKKNEMKTLRENVKSKSVGSSCTGARTGASGDDEMSAEDNLDITEVFEDVGVSPRSPKKAIKKEVILDEEMPSEVTILASGETGTRRRTRGGRKRTKTNNN